MDHPIHQCRCFELIRLLNPFFSDSVLLSLALCISLCASRFLLPKRNGAAEAGADFQGFALHCISVGTFARDLDTTLVSAST